MKDHALRKYRTENNMSLESLANLVGSTRATLSRVETWQQQPSLSLVGKLVLATGGSVSADDFINNEIYSPESAA